MKKLLFLLLFARVFAITAQNHHTPLTIGMRTGLASSSYWTAKEPGIGNRPLNGFQAGAIIEAGLNERLSMRLEVNFVTKGDAWYFQSPGEANFDIRDVFHYLEIPLLARYNVLDGPVEAYTIGGPYFATAMSNQYYEEDDKYEYHNFTHGDFGLQLGGGATMQAGPGRAFAELRFSQGLKDLDFFKDGTATRMRTIGLSIGYLYQIN